MHPEAPAAKRFKLENGNARNVHSVPDIGDGIARQDSPESPLTDAPPSFRLGQRLGRPIFQKKSCYISLSTLFPSKRMSASTPKTRPSRQSSTARQISQPNGQAAHGTLLRSSTSHSPVAVSNGSYFPTSPPPSKTGVNRPVKLRIGTVSCRVWPRVFALSSAGQFWAHTFAMSR